ncbi:Zinc finger cchc domain-containing protein 2 [Plakobranchus ocellatus]|uniref:Zinc finger cchc domain-containing protein 2 n=1 Tax=Plakobranchus ocellatus TaxID=259542 RepID=A0AAV4C148_9GAST|nr:Zinc finger cchc domain-containing protein 2 [Plakobranchus ocellatus]
MVKKEDLFIWFKNLQPHKRLDYMCALLHMCLPLELRFIGSVLEDLARKDFNHLRDAEIKANQRNDLSNNPTNNIDDAHLRNKISIALALMNSTNSSCADIIFRILENQVDSLLQLSRTKDIADQISLILTMSVHHPAFKFYQRNRLGEILQLLLDQYQDQFGDEDDGPFHIKQAQPQEAYTVHGPFSPCNSHSPVPDIPEKVMLKTIEVVSTRDDQSSKKGGSKTPREESQGRRPEYEIHATWSNGEVTQIFMKWKQLQEMHYKVRQRFPEEKEKKQRTIPVFPGNHSHRSEPLEVQIENLNSYFSQLTKVCHVLNCDILHTTLRNGPVIKHLPSCQAPAQPAIKAASPVSPQSGLQSVLSQASPSHEDYHPYAISSYRGSVCDNPAILTNSVCSSDPSHLSSSTNSPANSRTSSPAPVMAKASQAAMGAGKGVVLAQQQPQHQGSNIELSLNQLLCLLNLENYSDNLKEFSFKQILSMSTEDYREAGLPADAQVKLRTKLDQLKLTSPHGRNGIITKPPGLPPLPHQHTQQLHPTGQVPEIASPAFQFPFVQLSPSPLAYVGPPVNTFPHPHHILPYHQPTGQPTALLAAAPLMSSSAPNNQQQQQPPLPMSSSMTASHMQQDLLASPDFPNSEASSPPASPHLGQEGQQQRSGSTSGGSSTSSCDGGNPGQVAPILSPLGSSAPGYPILLSGGTGPQQQQLPAPLPMMSPADTLTPAEVKQLKAKPQQQMHGLDEPELDEEDMRPGYHDLNPNKLKGINQQVGMPGVGGNDESVMIMSGGPSQLIPAEILGRTDGTSPPSMPPSVMGVSSQSSAVLANGYMADSPLPLQPHAPIGRTVYTLPHGMGSLGYKLPAQPTHTGPGLHSVIKMPGLELPGLGGGGGSKNGNGNGGVGGASANVNSQGLMPHPTSAITLHHSYMPPPVAGPHHQSNNNGNNNNIITSSAGASNGSMHLISQLPPPPPHALVFAASQHQQQRGILTSVAGSTSMMTTTQSHQPGHSPSPGCCDVSSAAGMYQVNPGDALPPDTSSAGEHHGTPPSQTPPNQQVGSMKAQSHPSDQHSSTPSPPLVSSSGNGKAPIVPLGVLVSSSMLSSCNEPNPIAIRSGAGGAQHMVPYCIMVPTQNGIVQQQFYAPPLHPAQQAGGHHPQPPPPPPTFPNGLGPGAPTAHETYLRPLAAAAAAQQFTSGVQVPPSFYGNTVYHHHLQQQQQHHHHHHSSNNGSNHQGRNTGSPAGGNAQQQAKSVCYNCGQLGHRGTECKESTMETIASSFRLNYESKTDPQ